MGGIAGAKGLKYPLAKISSFSDPVPSLVASGYDRQHDEPEHKQRPPWEPAFFI